uniref:Uncharacterized protein n=1 Tax=Podarcis muralis TaxID=64176 RepID=A0A670IM76_PODMU
QFPSPLCPKPLQFRRGRRVTGPRGRLTCIMSRTVEALTGFHSPIHWAKLGVEGQEGNGEMRQLRRIQHGHRWSSGFILYPYRILLRNCGIKIRVQILCDENHYSAALSLYRRS